MNGYRCLLILNICVLFLYVVSQSHAAAVSDDREQFIYERPTMAKLSQLYWALGKFSLENNSAVDNFLRINECEVYKNYHNDEFEWRNIRESYRGYIKQNLEQFPKRFEIEQPIYLSEYDFERETFEIWDPYKIDGIKLFEVLAAEYDKKICDVAWNGNVPGYPRGIITELPRPISISDVKMSPELAKRFVTLKKKRAGSVSSKKELYQSRDAYMVMKLRYFSVDQERSSKVGLYRAKALAALEGIEIYADRNHKFLLYEEVFRERKGKTSAADELRKRLEARKKKREAERKAKESAQ